MDVADRKEFQEYLDSKLTVFHRYDAILQMMEMQLKNRHDMRKLHQQIEDTKKKKEIILERNNLLRQKLKERVIKNEVTSTEIDKLKSQHQEIIISQESKVAQMKHLWKSYMLAIDFYRSRLNSHIKLQEEFIIWTFDILPCDNKKKFMVKLVNKDGRWSCTDMVPKLKTRDALMEDLKETNNIQRFMVTVRNRFKKVAITKN